MKSQRERKLVKRLLSYFIIVCAVSMQLYGDCKRSKVNQIYAFYEGFCNNLGGACKPCVEITDLPVCIDQPGSYSLGRNRCFLQTDDNNAAITVCSDGVDIDFKGKSIQVAGPNAIAVKIDNQTGVTIRNGILKGTQVVSDSIGPTENVQFGVFASDSSHIRVENMVFQSFGAGVNVTKSNDVVISDSFFENGVTGIQAAAWGFGDEPVLVGFVDGVTIKDTHIRQMTQFGIYLRGNIRNVLVEKVIIDEIGRDGIFVDRNIFLVEDVTIDRTRISQVGSNGIFGQPLCRNWTIKDSQILKTGRNGIYMVGPRNLEVRNSEIFDTKLSGIFVGVRAANNVAIRSSQINNAGEMPLRIDNTTNLIIEDTNIANYLPIKTPSVRLVDILGGSVRGVTITNFGANPASNGFLLRGSTGVQCENLTIDYTFLAGQAAALNESNAFLFDGGNKNCSLVDSVLSSAARGITVRQDAQFSGVNTGITIENNSVTNMRESGIVIDNNPGAVIVGNTVSECADAGIDLFANTLNSAVRNNTVRSNGVGIRDGMFGNNQIYANFASQNSDNFIKVNLVVTPGPGVGSLENISG